MDIKPGINFIIEGDIIPGVPNIRAQVWWNGKTPTLEDSKWMQAFTINSITNWQLQGINPCVPEENTYMANLIMEFGPKVNIMP